MKPLETFAITLLGTLRDVLPICVVIAFFQFVVLRRRIANLRSVLVGLGAVVLGLALFLVGLNMALFPLGSAMATQLTSPAFVSSGKVGSAEDGERQMPPWYRYYWTYLFAFAVGAGTAFAEPALIAVALKAQEVSGGTIQAWVLRIAVALGVGCGVAVGSLRLILGIPLPYLIASSYFIVMLQVRYAPKQIIPLAFDTGGVSTSTVTVPLIAALGLGLTEQIPNRDPLVDGFGMIAFAVLFPMITVMGYAQIATWRSRKSLQDQGSAETTTKRKRFSKFWR